MKRIVVAFASATVSLLLCLQLAWAQEPDSARIRRLMPERDGIVKLGYTYTSDADVRSEPGSFAIHMLRFDGRVPIPIGDDIVFAPGVVFDLHHFRLHNTINYLDQNSLNAYDVGPTLGAVIKFDRNWMLALNFTPLISSDMKGLTGNDFQFKGYGMAGWAFSDSASFIFGVAVNKDFWRYLPIPIIGFVVRPEGSFFAFETVLPKYLRVDFRVASFCKLFVQGEYEGDVWYIRGDGTVPNHFGKLMEVHTGAGARFTIIEGLEIEAWGGIDPYRRVSFKDRAGLTIERRIDHAFFGEANIIITPKIFRR